MNTRSESFALTSLFLGAAAIGFSPIFVRLTHVAPEVSAFYRVALAVPLLWIWMLWQDRKSAAAPMQWSTRFALLGTGLFFSADLGFWHWSIQLTSVANATLLANFAPIFVTLAAVFLFGARISRLFLIGLLLSTSGLFILMGSDSGNSASHLFGDFLGLITAFFYAAYLLAVGHFRHRLSVARIMAWTSLGASIGLLPVVFLTGNVLVSPGPQDWLLLIGLAWISHALGQGLIANALAHLPTTFSSVGLLAQPLLAAVLAWWLFGEHIGLWQGIGGAIVLGGIYIAHRGRSPSSPKQTS